MISHAKYILYIILGIAAIVITSCDDEPFPTGFEGEVVFKADGKLDEDNLYLEAGREDFYMYTDVESKDNIMRFSGAFQKNDFCEAPCDEKLKIIINNYTLGGNFNIDSALYIGDYNLEPEVTVGSSEYQVDFLANSTGVAPFSYTWTLFDSNGSVTTSSIQNYSANFPSLNNITADLLLVDATGCTANYTDVLSTTPNSNCELDFSYTVFQDSLQNTVYDFQVGSVFFPDSSYFWVIESFDTSIPPIFFDNMSQFSQSFSPNNNPFPAKVSLFTFNCSSVIHKTINGNNSCGVKFSYTPTNIPTSSDTSIFSMVTIEYTTPDGQFYSSELGSQTGSTFEILYLEYYLQNERDQSTKSIEATVDCKLYNATGDFLNFTTNELIFSVSVPD